MKYFKLWFALALGAILAFFAIENMAVIQVTIFGTVFETRRIFLILSCVLVGFVLGKSIKLRN